MKKMTSSSLLIFSIAITFISLMSCHSGKQISTAVTPMEFARAINNDQWIFSASTALPTYGRSRNVYGSYFVKCNRHDLTVSLPYYGRLNSAAGALGGNPLDFHSNSFRLYKDNLKNGEWSVTVDSPNPEVRSMVFTFYDNGTAQLSVVMTNRSPISFNGTVAPSKS